MNSQDPEKILVVGPAWVGDMIMAQSLFISLKNSYPNCQIDVLAPLWSLPLLDRMPEISKSIVMPLQHGQFGLLARIKLGRQLRSEHYGRAIILPNSWKSALIPYFAKIPLRAGFIGEWRWWLLNDVRQLDTKKLTMTVQRFVALGLPQNVQQPPSYQHPRIPIDKSGQDTVLKKFGLSLCDKILVLCPGAEYGPSKRWPAEYFAKVAKAKIEQGWHVWLMGSGNDADMATPINEETGQQCHNFIGQTSLTEAIDLLSLAHVVIANDSGLMHLAAALNKKVIAIYGSTSPDFAPPLCDKSEILYLSLPCAPCRKRVCPLYPAGHPDYTHCLTGIKPERILELIER